MQGERALITKCIEHTRAATVFRDGRVLLPLIQIKTGFLPAL
jgi:hypothetical protein